MHIDLNACPDNEHLDGFIEGHLEEWNSEDSASDNIGCYKAGYDDIPIEQLPPDDERFDDGKNDDVRHTGYCFSEDEDDLDGKDNECIGGGEDDKEDGENDPKDKAFFAKEKEHGETDTNDEAFCVSLSNSIQKRLEIGSILDSLDQIYLLYCEYGRLTGFSVRKSNQEYFYKTTEVRMKSYCCSYHGKSNQTRSDEVLANHKQQVRRTCCLAKLVVVRERDGPWKVLKFEKEHNHELVPYDQSYMLRSCRQMTHANKSLIEALTSAGINTATACRFLEKESGGPSNTGFTRKDAYNHMTRLKLKTKVENSDADALRNFFLKKANHEPGFYWDVQSDCDGRLMNFFYRDVRCATDYEYFGDVLSVDSTHKTNKYKLVCVPFVGINHHMKNVLFGIGFLSNENTASFDWLFSTFLDSMYSSEPDIVFSDECRAIMNAVDANFKHASHRLCQWHLNRNAPSHFGKWNRHKGFHNQWHRCVNGCDSSEEFEKEWSTLLENYELSPKSKSWFNKQYKLRRRWSSAFTRDKFCGGLHATSQSELTNKVLKQLCASSSSLHEFVLAYEEVLGTWRRKESEDDTLSIGLPGQTIKNNKVLMQFAKIFTRKVFKVFEVEYSHLGNVKLIKKPNDMEADFLEYSGISDVDHGKKRSLTVNKVDNSIKCSCKMWETSGVLCRHIFRVLLDMEETIIPEKYLLKRFSRTAKMRNSMNYVYGDSKGGCADTCDELSFTNHVIRDTCDLLEFAKTNSKCRSIILHNNVKTRAEVYRVMGFDPDNLSNQSWKKNLSNSGVPFRDPPLPKRRAKADSPPPNHFDRPKTRKKLNPQDKVFKVSHVECSGPTSQASLPASSFGSQYSRYYYESEATTTPNTPSVLHTQFPEGFNHFTHYERPAQDPMFERATQ